MKELKQSIEQMPHVESVNYVAGSNNRRLEITLKHPIDKSTAEKAAAHKGFQFFDIRPTHWKFNPWIGFHKRVSTFAIEHSELNGKPLSQPKVTIAVTNSNLPAETRESLRKIVNALGTK